MRSDLGTLSASILVLAALATAAQAFPPGSLLILDGDVVQQWKPGDPASTSVIAGSPLFDPRAVAIDRSGNAIVTDRVMGTFRYSPIGDLVGAIGPAGIDVAVGPTSGIVFILDENGDVQRADPPAFVAGGIAGPRGIAVAAGDVILVTSAASGGQLLRVSPGPTTVLASGLGSNIARPALDRFGNVLVPRHGHVIALDPSTGAIRGTFLGSMLDDPQDVTTTSGDRYFLADGNAAEACRIVELDPITGVATLANDPYETSVCSNTPSSIAAVPGGVAAPKLATGDLVLSDPGAFRGGGGIFRIDPVTGAVRALRLGGGTIPLGRVEVGATRELVAAGDSILRIDPLTGSASLLWTAAADSVSEGAAFDASGSLLVTTYSSDPDLHPPFLDLAGAILRIDRATGAISTLFSAGDFEPYNLMPVLNPCGWEPCELAPVEIETAVRAAPGAPMYQHALLTLRTNWPASSGASHGAGSFPLPPLGPSGATAALASIINPWFSIAVAPTGALGYYRTATTIYKSALAGTSVAFATGGSLVAPKALDVEHYGDVVVADANAFGGGGGVIRLAAANGAQSRLTTANFVDPTGIAVVPPPACSDGIDNDGDSAIDFLGDSGCLSYDDAWETVDCSDGIDNDGDGAVDYAAGGGGDPSCISAQLAFERTECSDGADDDGDGFIDLADPQCVDATDNREAPNAACGLLGIEVMLVVGWAVGRKANARRR